MILGCDAAGTTRTATRSSSTRWSPTPSGGGRDARPEAVAALRALPGHVRRPGGRARAATWCRSRPRSRSRRPPACPTAWLTAYRMLFTRGDLKAGDTVLVQGAGGGVATALILLARAAGLRVLATSRDEAKRARALEIGAHDVFESGARLPVKVDAVMETVGRATWSHSIRALRPGGRIVISGTTSGPKLDDAELTRIFFLQLQVDRLDDGHPRRAGLAGHLLDATGTRPLVDRTLPMDQARDGFAAMAEGDLFGKIVFTR